MGSCLMCKKLYTKELDGIQICEGYRHLTFEEKTHMSDEFQCDEFEGENMANCFDCKNLYISDLFEEPKCSKYKQLPFDDEGCLSDEDFNCDKFEEDKEEMVRLSSQDCTEDERPKSPRPGSSYHPVCDKPPVGLKPRKVHDHERMLDIIDAMNRYVKAGKNVPTEWIKEFQELQEKYKDED